MARLHAQSTSRRLLIVGLCLVASLVVATSLAWACAPAGGVTGATPKSGPAGTVTTVTGDGASGATSVEVRWQSADGPILASNVPISSTGLRSFSAQVTIPANATPGPKQLYVVQRDSEGKVVQTHQALFAPFEVTRVAISLAPASGLPGSSTTVTGTDFATVPITIRWGSPTAAVLADTHGPDFTTQVTIPAGAPGDHSIFAVPSINSSDRASAIFRITAPLLPVAPPLGGAADRVGPAITAAALASGNGTRAVSRRGVVRLFCGRFAEAGVSGVCGARSVRPLKVKVRASAEGSRSVVLRLRAKRFSASKGRPVMVRFRLSRSNLKMLKAAKKVRMRGTVDARDAKGNATKVPFGFTLKAPKSRSK